MKATTILGILWMTAVWGIGAADDTNDAHTRFVARYAFQPPPVSTTGVCEGAIGVLPSFRVTPVHTGRQLVRVSLPFAPGALPKELGVKVQIDGQVLDADVRWLTLYPGQPPSVRRAIVTCVYDFHDLATRHATLSLTTPPADPPRPALDGDLLNLSLGGTRMTIDANGLVVKNENDVVQWSAQLVAQETRSVHHEIVEWSRHYAWVRVLSVGDEWARIVEVQADAVGTVTVQAHVQRQQKGDGFAPDLGWEIRGLPWPETVSHAFATGEPYEVHSSDGGAIVAFPRAAQERRGRVSVEGQVLRFMRCEAGERVPMQQTAWRSAGFIIGPTAVSKRTPLFEPEQDIRIAPEAYQPAYGVTLPPDLSAWPTLDDLRRATNAA